MGSCYSCKSHGGRGCSYTTVAGDPTMAAINRRSIANGNVNACYGPSDRATLIGGSPTKNRLSIRSGMTSRLTYPYSSSNGDAKNSSSRLRKPTVVKTYGLVTNTKKPAAAVDGRGDEADVKHRTPVALQSLSKNRTGALVSLYEARIATVHPTASSSRSSLGDSRRYSSSQCVDDGRSGSNLNNGPRPQTSGPDLIRNIQPSPESTNLSVDNISVDNSLSDQGSRNSLHSVQSLPKHNGAALSSYGRHSLRYPPSTPQQNSTAATTKSKFGFRGFSNRKANNDNNTQNDQNGNARITHNTTESTTTAAASLDANCNANTAGAKVKTSRLQRFNIFSSKNSDNRVTGNENRADVKKTESAEVPSERKSSPCRKKINDSTQTNKEGTTQSARVTPSESPNSNQQVRSSLQQKSTPVPTPNSASQRQTKHTTFSIPDSKPASTLSAPRYGNLNHLPRPASHSPAISKKSVSLSSHTPRSSPARSIDSPCIIVKLKTQITGLPQPQQAVLIEHTSSVTDTSSVHSNDSHSTYGLKSTRDVSCSVALVSEDNISPPELEGSAGSRNFINRIPYRQERVSPETTQTSIGGDSLSTNGDSGISSGYMESNWSNHTFRSHSEGPMETDDCYSDRLSLSSQGHSTISKHTPPRMNEELASNSKILPEGENLNRQQVKEYTSRKSLQLLNTMPDLIVDTNIFAPRHYDERIFRLNLDNASNKQRDDVPITDKLNCGLLNIVTEPDHRKLLNMEETASDVENEPPSIANTTADTVTNNVTRTSDLNNSFENLLSETTLTEQWSVKSEIASSPSIPADDFSELGSGEAESHTAELTKSTSLADTARQVLSRDASSFELSRGARKESNVERSDSFHLEMKNGMSSSSEDHELPAGIDLQTSSSAPLSPPSEERDCFLDDEITDQPELFACQTSGLGEFEDIFRRGIPLCHERKNSLHGSLKLVHSGSPRARRSLTSTACPASGSLSPCSSLDSDDLMLDFDNSERSSVYGDPEEDCLSKSWKAGLWATATAAEDDCFCSDQESAVRRHSISSQLTRHRSMRISSSPNALFAHVNNGMTVTGLTPTIPNHNHSYSSLRGSRDRLTPSPNHGLSSSATALSTEPVSLSSSAQSHLRRSSSISSSAIPRVVPTPRYITPAQDGTASPGSGDDHHGWNNGLPVDPTSYRAATQDISQIKLLLLKLKRSLQEAETLNPFDTSHGKNGLFLNLANSEPPQGVNNSKEADGDRISHADLEQDNADLRRQVIFLQQRLEEKDKSNRQLQQQLAKYTSSSQLHHRPKEMCNAACQTDKPRSLLSSSLSSSIDDSSCGSTISIHQPEQ